MRGVVQPRVTNCCSLEETTNISQRRPVAGWRP
jgi:hypothetical protein